MATAHIPDTQSERDERHLAIQRVGVKGVRYPVHISVQGQTSTSVAEWSLDVALPAEQKGTHMSRFVAWLHQLHAANQPLDANSLKHHMQNMLQLLHAQEGRIEACFPFFIDKAAPVSGLRSLMDYQGAWVVQALKAQEIRVDARVVVPVKSLCPCSKEISDYGAHNQRSHVTIQAEVLDAGLNFFDLVRAAELAASSEIWGLLKRADEKYITERAYDNPKFVEDLIRDVALQLNAEPRIGHYRVEVENFESIHNHSAFAVIER